FGGAGVLPINAKPSNQFVSQIDTVNFTYGTADQGVVGATGIPKVHVGKPLTFVNFDTVADIWHTFTSCRQPCSGSYGLDYPTASRSDHVARRRLRPMSHGNEFGMQSKRWWPDLGEDLPVDVMPNSNGEFIPPEPTEEQRQIMRLARAESDRLARKFGMSRRSVFPSATAYAYRLWAL